MTARLGRYPTRSDGQGPAATIVPPLEHTADDLALFQRFEEDWSIACEYRPHGRQGDSCGAIASWWVICRECGLTVAWCESHRMLKFRELSSAYAVLFGYVYCDRCSAQTGAAHWQDLFLVEPIGRRS